jgi:organic radical activating enzyme
VCGVRCAVCGVRCAVCMTQDSASISQRLADMSSAYVYDWERGAGVTLSEAFW